PAIHVSRFDTFKCPRSSTYPSSIRLLHFGQLISALAISSLTPVLIQKSHDVRFARIEFEAIDRNLELFCRKAPLDFRGTDLRRDAGFRPRIHPTLSLGIAIASSIDRHDCQPVCFSTAPNLRGCVLRNQQTSAELFCSRRNSPSRRSRVSPPVPPLVALSPGASFPREAPFSLQIFVHFLFSFFR